MTDKEEKDEAYRQRNYLVAALARLFPGGICPTNLPGWEPDWRGCVLIDLPTGQISYHYHDSQAFLFEGLPTYEKPWDGHDKETVHARLLALRCAWSSLKPAKQDDPIQTTPHVEISWSDNGGQDWLESKPVIWIGAAQTVIPRI